MPTGMYDRNTHISRMKRLVRFSENIDVNGPIHAIYGQCWSWTGSTFVGRGYGQFKFNGEIRAHRVAYLLTRGPIADKLCVCHKCDNENCVNPAHLFLGTHVDNMKDMAQKERVVSPPGEKSGKNKLTEDDVKQIRRLATSKTHKEISCMFGISDVQVSNIVRRRHWKHLK